MAISDALLPEFDQEMANTRKFLERIPDDKFKFKPHEKSTDMGGLASHIVMMPDWGADTMTKDNFDYAPVGGPAYQMPVLATQKQLLEAFDKNVAKARAALAAGDDAAFMKPWSLLAGGKVIFTMPRVGVIRTMILNHIIHHRGQLSVYLRLNNIPVPGPYGPSADEMPPGGGQPS